MPDLFEAMMLFCFSASWYWSIAKMLKTGQAAGKSAGFVRLIVLGYLLGMLSKVVEFKTTGVLNPLIYLYVWNLIVTLFDLWLVQRLTGTSNMKGALHA